MDFNGDKCKYCDSSFVQRTLLDCHVSCNHREAFQEDSKKSNSMNMSRSLAGLVLRMQSLNSMTNSMLEPLVKVMESIKTIDKMVAKERLGAGSS